MPKCSKITRDWDACTTTEIENPTAAGWQAVDEPTHPFLTNRRNAEPFEIDVCDFVVAETTMRIGSLDIPAIFVRRGVGMGCNRPPWSKRKHWFLIAVRSGNLARAVLLLAAGDDLQRIVRQRPLQFEGLRRIGQKP